jgi:CRP-like cAMP-binding protein
MVSPELLRRYPFFSVFNDAALNTVAMATEEVRCVPGDVLFEADLPATHLYLVLEGTLELSIVAADRHGQGMHKLFHAGEIDPGEIAGISALIAPCLYTATGHVTAPSRLLRIDAQALRELCGSDPRLDAALIHAVAQTTMRRLHDTRVQLLAARA